MDTNMLEDMVNYRIKRVEYDHLTDILGVTTFHTSMLGLTTPEIKQLIESLSFHEEEIISRFNMFFGDNKDTSIYNLLYGTVINRNNPVRRLNFTKISFISRITGHYGGLIYLNYLQNVKSEHELSCRYHK